MRKRWAKALTRLAALVWLLVALTGAARGEGMDLEAEAVALSETVRQLAANPIWRSAMGISGEIADLLDGFAAAPGAELAAVYPLRPALEELLAAAEGLSAEMAQLLYPRLAAGLGNQLGAALGTVHLAAQNVALASRYVPLPAGWAADALVLLRCGEQWSALATFVDLGTGVLMEQCVFLGQPAAEAAARLEALLGPALD